MTSAVSWSVAIRHRGISRSSTSSHWTQRPEDEHRLFSPLLHCSCATTPSPPTCSGSSLRPGCRCAGHRAAAAGGPLLRGQWSALARGTKPSLDLVVVGPGGTVGARVPSEPPVEKGSSFRSATEPMAGARPNPPAQPNDRRSLTHLLARIAVVEARVRRPWRRDRRKIRSRTILFAACTCPTTR